MSLSKLPQEVCDLIVDSLAQLGVAKRRKNHKSEYKDCAKCGLDLRRKPAEVKYIRPLFYVKNRSLRAAALRVWVNDLSLHICRQDTLMGQDLSSLPAGLLSMPAILKHVRSIELDSRLFHNVETWDREIGELVLTGLLHTESLLLWLKILKLSPGLRKLVVNHTFSPEDAMQEFWIQKVLSKIENQNLTILRINAADANPWHNLLATQDTVDLRHNLRRLELRYYTWHGYHPCMLLVGLEGTALPRLEELDIKAPCVEPEDLEEFDFDLAQVPPASGTILLPSLKSIALHDVFGLRSQDLACLFKACENTLTQCKLWWVTLLEGSWHDVFRQVSLCRNLQVLSVGRLQNNSHWDEFEPEEMCCTILPAVSWDFSQLTFLQLGSIEVEPENLARLILSCKDSLRRCELFAISTATTSLNEVWKPLVECALVRDWRLTCVHSIRAPDSQECVHEQSKKESLSFLVKHAAKWGLRRVIVDYEDLENGDYGGVKHHQ